MTGSLTNYLLWETSIFFRSKTKGEKQEERRQKTQRKTPHSTENIYLVEKNILKMWYLIRTNSLWMIN